MAQRPLLALGGLVLAAFALSGAAAPNSGIKVRVLGQGTPVAHVPVRVRVNDGTTPENWPPEAKLIAEDSTGTDGTVSFPDIPPGRYIVVAPCNRLPGDWIGGSSATVLEVLPERATQATLTLRRGGHILGKAIGAPEILAQAAVRTETPTALASGCPMLAPTKIAPDGTFEVAKAPIGDHSIVRIELPLGDGSLWVSQDFKLEKAETVSGTWQLPSLEPDQLGTGRVTMRDDKGKPVYHGTVEFSLRQTSPPWRYIVSKSVGDKDTVTVATSLPPGRYFVRAWPEPGADPWWMVSPESLNVEPGKTAALRLKARLQTPQTVPAPAPAPAHAGH